MANGKEQYFPNILPEEQFLNNVKRLLCCKNNVILFALRIIEKNYCFKTELMAPILYETIAFRK